MYDILYGWFENNKKWVFQLEEAAMMLENWQYTEESVLQMGKVSRVVWLN